MNNVVNPSVGGGGSGIAIGTGSTQFTDISRTTGGGSMQYLNTRTVCGGGINFWVDRRDTVVGPLPSSVYTRYDRRWDQKTYYTT